MTNGLCRVMVPACALGMLAGLALPVPAASAVSAEPGAQRATEFHPHPEHMTDIFRAADDCLVLRSGVVRTGSKETCAATLAQAGRRMVIQLDGPLTKQHAADLAAAGVTLGQYLPTNAFIVSTAGVDADAVDALDFVRWHGPFDRAWKASRPPAEREFITQARRDIAARGEVAMLVTLFQDADTAATAKELAAIPGAVVLNTSEAGGNPILSVVVPRGQVVRLTDPDDVLTIEEAPEPTARMATSSWIVQSNIDGAYTIHDHGLDGTGQIVGVMDLPVDSDNCVFDDTEPVGPTHRKWVAINGNSSPSSHGTAVCSMIAGDNNDQPGDLRGIAYKAKMTFNLIPSFTESALLARLEQHHSQGARVHTNSWGDDGTTSYNGLARAIDVFSHDNEDDLVVFAATNLSTLRTPENSRNVLAVGATWDTPLQTDHRFGGIGPTADGRRKPEIYAPGNSVRAAGVNTCSSTNPGGGTSFAAPQIAGAAALVREYYMEGFYPSGAATLADEFTPSGALMKATLLNSAVDMTGEPGYPTFLEGWGRVLLDGALHFAGEARTMRVADVRNTSPEALSTGETAEIMFNVDGSTEKLKATMVFTDKEAAPGAALVAVNDLDLELQAPSGAIFRGNVFSGGLSVTGGGADALNNVEQVHLLSPETGTWTARIIGNSIPMGPQGYAFVVTGEVADATAPCPADLDGSGTVDGTDLAVLIAGWGVSNLQADFNGSGTVDGADLAILLAAWGPCP